MSGSLDFKSGVALNAPNIYRMFTGTGMAPNTYLEYSYPEVFEVTAKNFNDH